MARKPTLVLDSPVRPSQEPADAPAPVPEPASESQEWREWTGKTATHTYRHPDELLDELKARAERLGTSTSTLATVLITLGLDLDDDTLVEAMDRADRAISRGRRRTRARTGN